MLIEGNAAEVNFNKTTRQPKTGISKEDLWHQPLTPLDKSFPVSYLSIIIYNIETVKKYVTSQEHPSAMFFFLDPHNITRYVGI